MNIANNGRGINLYLDPWLPVVDLKAGKKYPCRMP